MRWVFWQCLNVFIRIARGGRELEDKERVLIDWDPIGTT